MVTYNVEHALARAVIFGEKASILKPHGKRKHAQKGALLHIDCGNVPPDYGRSEHCHRLMVVPCCLSLSVTITERHMLRDGEIDTQGCRMEHMAHAEGFADFSGLRFHLDRMYGLPWEGQLIRWKPAQAEFRAQWPLIEPVAVEKEEGGE
jgi:hypothetical protein